MAELSRADQVLVAAATVLALPVVRTSGAERQVVLQTISDVLPHATRTNGVFGRLAEAARALVDAREDRHTDEFAERELRYALEAFFRDRMGRAHEAWRVGQARRD